MGQALTWKDNLALTPCSGWLSPLPAGWAADARSPSYSLSLCIFTVGEFFLRRRSELWFGRSRTVACGAVTPVHGHGTPTLVSSREKAILATVLLMACLGHPPSYARLKIPVLVVR